MITWWRTLYRIQRVKSVAHSSVVAKYCALCINNMWAVWMWSKYRLISEWHFYLQCISQLRLSLLSLNFLVEGCVLQFKVPLCLRYFNLVHKLCSHSLFLGNCFLQRQHHTQNIEKHTHIKRHLYFMLWIIKDSTEPFDAHCCHYMGGYSCKPCCVRPG